MFIVAAVGFNLIRTTGHTGDNSYRTDFFGNSKCTFRNIAAFPVDVSK